MHRGALLSGSGDGCRMRSSVVAARPPLSKHLTFGADASQGDIMAFSACTSALHFLILFPVLCSVQYEHHVPCDPVPA